MDIKVFQDTVISLSLDYVRMHKNFLWCVGYALQEGKQSKEHVLGVYHRVYTSLAEEMVMIFCRSFEEKSNNRLSVQRIVLFVKEAIKDIDWNNVDFEDDAYNVLENISDVEERKFIEIFLSDFNKYYQSNPEKSKELIFLERMKLYRDNYLGHKLGKDDVDDLSFDDLEKALNVFRDFLERLYVISCVVVNSKSICISLPNYFRHHILQSLNTYSIDFEDQVNTFWSIQAREVFK